MKRKIVIILIVIAFISLGITGVLALKNNKNEKNETVKLTENKKEEPENKIEEKQEEIKEPEPIKPIYCLLLGINENEGLLLTDTIMLGAYYPEKKQISMLSIPRDTFIGENENTADGFDKINALYQSGGGGEEGAKKILEKVSEITGIEITNYVAINTAGLRKIVDEIGGVYFDVPIDMTAGDQNSEGFSINLKKGYQLIDGEKAEQLLRFRHNSDGTTYPSEYGQEDFGRMKTQREFLTALAKQILEGADATKIKDIAEIVSKNIESNMKITALAFYALEIKSYTDLNFDEAYLPGSSQKLGNQRLWFYKLDQQETQKTIQEIFLNYEE